MVLPCRICMHETSNHNHPTWSVSWSISLTVFLRTNSSRPCPIHGSLSRPAAYCMPAGDLAAIVVLARRSIRRSISLYCLSGTVLCTACLRLPLLVCRVTLGNTDMASYRSTVPVLGLSTCLEVHTI